MKYIKTFEKINVNKPKAGDYVICGGEYSSNMNFINHIKNSIGLVTSIDKNSYEKLFIIKYDYDYNQFDLEIEYNENKMDLYTTRINDIKYWSKNKEELELILAANKYNL